MQNKTSVFDKKGSNTIWLKQIATWRKKSIDEEKNLLLRALKTYLWGLKEDPITEDPKENPINEKPKEDPYYCETKRQSYQWISSGASGPSMTFAPKSTLFGFLVMVYDRVHDENKFSKKNFGLERLRFPPVLVRRS